MSNRINLPSNLLPSPSSPLGSTQHHQPLGVYYAPTQSPLSHQHSQHSNYANLSLQQQSPESTQASLTQQSGQKYNYDPQTITSAQFQLLDSIPAKNSYAKESINLNGISDNTNYQAIKINYDNNNMLQTPSPGKLQQQQQQYPQILESTPQQSHYALQSFSGSQPSSSSGLEKKSSQYALSSLLKATPPFHNPTNPIPLSSEFQNMNYSISGERQPSNNSGLQQQQQGKSINLGNLQDHSMNVGSSNLNQFLKAKGYSATATSTPINQYRDIQVSSFHNNLANFEPSQIPFQSKTESFIEQDQGLTQQRQFLPSGDLYRKPQQLYSQSPSAPASELTSTAYLRNIPSSTATETYESQVLTRPTGASTSPNQYQFERTFKKAEILPLQHHNSTKDESQTGQQIQQQLLPPRTFLGKKTIQINLAPSISTLNQVSSTPSLTINTNQNTSNNINTQMIKRNNNPVGILPSNINTNVVPPAQTNSNNTIGCYSSYSSLPTLVNPTNNSIHPLTAAQINGTNTSLNDFQTIPGFSGEISTDNQSSAAKINSNSNANKFNTLPPMTSTTTNNTNYLNSNVSTTSNPSINTNNNTQHYRLINGTVPISSIQLSPNQFSLNHDNQSLSSRDHISSSPQQQISTGTPNKNTQKYSSLDHNAFQKVIKMISPQPISSNSNLSTLPTGIQQNLNNSNPGSQNNYLSKNIPTFSQFQANQSAYKTNLQTSSSSQSASKIIPLSNNNNVVPLTSTFSLKDLPLWKPPMGYQEDKLLPPRASSQHPRNGSLGNQNSISVISPLKTQIKSDLQQKEQQQQQQSSSGTKSSSNTLPSPPAQFTHNLISAAQLLQNHQPITSSAQKQLQQQTYEIPKEFSFKKKSPSDHLSNATDLSIQQINIPPENGDSFDGSSSPSPDNSTHDTPRTDNLNGIQKIPSLVVQPNFLPQHFKQTEEKQSDLSYSSQQQSTSDVYKLYKSVMQQQIPQQNQLQKPINTASGNNVNPLSQQQSQQQQPQLSSLPDQDRNMPSSTRAMQPPYMTSSPQKKPISSESPTKGYQLTPPKQQQQSYIIPKSYSNNSGYNIVSSPQQYSISPLQSNSGNYKNPTGQISSAAAAAKASGIGTTSSTSLSNSTQSPPQNLASGQQKQRISFTPIIGLSKSPQVNNSNTIKNNLTGFQQQNIPTDTRQRSSQSATAENTLNSASLGVSAAPANRMKSPNTDYKQKIWENILIQRKIKQNSSHTSPSTACRNEQPFYGNQVNSSSERSFNNLIKQSSPGQQQEILPQKQSIETITYRLQQFDDTSTVPQALSPNLPNQQRNGLNINGIQPNSEKSSKVHPPPLQINLEVPHSAVQNPYYSDSRAMTFSQMSGNSSSSPSGQNSPVFTTSQQKILDQPQGQQKSIPSIFSAAIITREDRVSSIQVQSNNQAAENIDKALRMSFGGDSPNSTFV